MTQTNIRKRDEPASRREAARAQYATSRSSAANRDTVRRIQLPGLAMDAKSRTKPTVASHTAASSNTDRQLSTVPADQAIHASPGEFTKAQALVPAGLRMRKQLAAQSAVADTQVEPKVANSSPVTNHLSVAKPPLVRLEHTSIHRKRRKQLIFRKPMGKVFSAKKVTTLTIVLVLAATAYVMYDTLRTNSQIRQQASVHLPTSSGDESTNKESEGQDETPVPSSSVDSYKVAANTPRLISIPKINVHARVLPMTVNTDGSLQAPRNIFDAGWYSSSAQPGAAGAVAIDGHSSGKTHQGLLGNLDKLIAGDIITIERGDSEKLNYKVMTSEVIELDKVDMTKFLTPQGSAEGLNIMTCTGQWINGNATMDHRVIVYAKRV